MWNRLSPGGSARHSGAHFLGGWFAAHPAQPLPGQCSVAIKLMGVSGPKLMEDERDTQDLILVSPASFVTPDIKENAKLQRWVRAKAPLSYFANPFSRHPLHLAMQLLYSPMQSSPLETQYYSNVPFLLGEGQAVQYSLRPCSAVRSRIPVRPTENYLREAMARTLADGDWSFDFLVQVQTDPHRMPIEDATVKWPERLSPYVPVGRLRLPAQRFDSDAQLAFADVLRYNPWHALPEHKPLGNSNRARRRMYWEMADLRQSMNQVQHVEPLEGRADLADDAIHEEGGRPVRAHEIQVVLIFLVIEGLGRCGARGIRVHGASTLAI